MKKVLCCALLALLTLMACQKPKEAQTPGQGIFSPVDTNFSANTLIVPQQGFVTTVLFSQGDMVKAEWADKVVPAKGSHDFLAYLPIDGSSTHGILWTNHESNTPNPVLGDGGGATVMEVFSDSAGQWKLVGFPHAIDFSSVGGTMKNCLGGVTPWNTIVTSEEIEPTDNRMLNSADTMDIEGWARWKNYGWMVEVDPFTRKALGKRYAMGRFMHEGALFMPDKRTCYLMDDRGPGAFFKFVADRPEDLSEGVLYAFQQSKDGNSGTWLPMSRNRDSLLYARRYAFQDSATIFIRMEDLVLHPDGTIYISETGLDRTDLSQAIKYGGRPAKHLAKFHVGEGIYDDKRGRILRFDPQTNRLSVFLEAGTSSADASIDLANPDNMALDTKRNLLVIQEDLVARSAGRMPDYAQDRTINEIYVLDLGIANPSLDDLQRLAVAPLGSETTGATWTPDFSTLFFNIQHPSSANAAPYKKACTVALAGWNRE